MSAGVVVTAANEIEVYRIPFDGPAADIPPPETVGAKAHNLMRLASRGLNVPPGFVLATGLCRDYLREGNGALAGLDAVLARELQWLGERTGRHFGDPRRPLLLSVRSGAAVSMPGMMETVLNIGLNPAVARGLTRLTGNPRLAFDCQSRLIEQFAEVVYGVAPAAFLRVQESLLDQLGLESRQELDTAEAQRLVAAYRELFEAATGHVFPSGPHHQLKAAIKAVLQSWSSGRARTYRSLHGIPDDLGTATLVQTMVFGNAGLSSGSGVGFTRNPADGRAEIYVDYLANAQGEDVVSGRRRALGPDELRRRAPTAYDALLDATSHLEEAFSEMQDFEFTVEQGTLFILQSRTGKRTPLAALRIAHDLVAEGRLSPADALTHLGKYDLDALEIVTLRPGAGQAPLFRGIPASPGVVAGRVLFDPARIADFRGGDLVLVRPTAETGDIGALAEVGALLTVQGARTSHAAVVARELGKACIVGCEGLTLDADGRGAAFATERIREGDMLSVNGMTGEVFLGALEVIHERPTALLNEVRAWRGLAADTPHGA